MLRRLLIAAAVLGVLGMAFLWWASGRVQREIQNGVVEAAIVGAARDQLGLEIELGAIRVATFPVLSIEGLRVRGLDEDVLRVAALRVRLDVSDYVSGRLVIDEVRLVKPEIHLERDPAGVLNVQAVIQQVKAHRARLREAAKTDQQRQLEKVLAEMHELERGLPPRPGASQPPGDATTPPAPAAPVGASPPPAPMPDPEPAPPPRPMNQGPVVLRRVAIEAGRLAFVDRAVGETAFRATLEEMELDVVLPGHPGAPLVAELYARLLGAPVKLTAAVDPLRRRGPVSVSVRGLPLGAVQPYLTRRLPVPMDLGQIPLHLEGRVELDGGPVDYELEVEIPESTIQVVHQGRPLAARVALEVGVKKDHATLRRLTLALGDALALELGAEVQDFADPRVKARLRTTRFDLTSLLALLPEQTATRLRALEPRLDLGLDAIVEGRVKTREFHPDVSLELGPASVRLKLAEEPLEISLPRLWVRLDDEALRVQGLEVQVAGVKLLAGDLAVTGYRQLPRLELGLRVPGVRVAELVAVLPGKVPLESERARAGLARARDLDLEGSVGLTLATTVDTAFLPELEPFHQVRTLPELVAAVKRHPELARELASPAGLARLEELGALALGLELQLEGLRATVKKDALEVPVEVQGRVRAGIRGVEVPGVSARALGAEVLLRGGVRGLPGPPQLDLSLHVGAAGGRALDLAELVAVLPAPLREKAERFSPTGVFEASASVLGPVTAPDIAANLALQSLGARLATPGGEVAVLGLPRLDARLEGGGIRLGPAEITTPLGPIGLAAEVDDLRGARRFRVRVATPGAGLDLLKALPFLPEALRGKLEARQLERAQLDLRVDALGIPESPEVHLKAAVHLPTSKLLASLDATDLRGEKPVRFELTTGPEGIRLDKLVQRLPPELREKLRAPLNGGLSFSLKGGGQLAHPESLEAKGQVDLGLPGGEVRVRFRVDDPLGEKRFAAGLETSISRLDEVLAFLPEPTATRLRELKPSAEFMVSAKARGTPTSIEIEAATGLRHAALLVPLGDERMPVLLEPATLDLRGTLSPRPGMPPGLDLHAGLEVNALAQHPVKGPLDLRIRAKDLHYDGRDLELDGLDIEALSQPLTLAGTITDVKGARELDLKVGLDLRIPELMARLVPPEAEIRSAGALDVKATIGGTAVRPEWTATMHLRDFFLDAYKLKGIPVAIGDATFVASTDDLVIQPFRVKMGGNDNDFFLSGSFKELTRTENFWRALKEDRDAVLERLEKVLQAKGGKTAVVKMVGNETLLRILGSSSHKIIIHVDSPDMGRPFTFKTLLTGDESKNFDFYAEKVIEKYRGIALDQLRGKLGVTPRLFGQEAGAVPRGAKLYVVVLDQKFNMVYPKKIPFWRLTVTPVKF